MIRYFIIGGVIVILAPFFYMILKIIARSLGWGKSHTRREPNRSREDMELERRTKNAPMPVEQDRLKTYKGIDIEYEEELEGEVLYYLASAEHRFRKRKGGIVDETLFARALTRKEAYEQICDQIDRFIVRNDVLAPGKRG